MTYAELYEAVSKLAPSFVVGVETTRTKTTVFVQYSTEWRVFIPDVGSAKGGTAQEAYDRIASLHRLEHAHRGRERLSTTSANVDVAQEDD